MNIDKFWNKKIIGIAGALYQFLPAFYLNILDKLSTKVQTLNMLKSGNNVVIQCKTVIRDPKNISLGDNIHIGREVTISSEISASKMIIGSDTSIAKECVFDYSGNLEIGKRCLFSEGVVIETHHHGLNPRDKPQPLALKIEDNVWIGMKAIILHNVNTIGKNSIIGACSVVTKDVPDNVIVAGNPAKIIRRLDEI